MEWKIVYKKNSLMEFGKFDTLEFLRGLFVLTFYMQSHAELWSTCFYRVGYKMSVIIPTLECSEDDYAEIASNIVDLLHNSLQFETLDLGMRVH